MLFRQSLPSVERKSDTDDAVGNENTEILADLRASHQVFPRKGRDDEKSVEEHRSKKRLSYRCFRNGSAADKERRDGEGSDLDVRAVDLHITDVLEKDELSPCGQNSRKDDGDDTYSVDLDSRDFSDMPVLSHGPEVLSELRLEKKDDGDA